MIAYLIYIFTVIIGIYVFYNNITPLIEIGIPDNNLEFGKFMVSFLPAGVGAFMVYFGLTSLYSLIKKDTSKAE